MNESDIKASRQALIEKWNDPEFWTLSGALMDSQDCAAELEALLEALPAGER